MVPTCSLTDVFQSTLPRRERRESLSERYSKWSISIHAPTKGATNVLSCFFFSIFISIHAPTKGATKIDDKLQSAIDISIHAPTKGATCLYGLFGWSKRPFNPRSHEESDTDLRLSFPPVYNFNPRSHEGSDSSPLLSLS